MRKHRSTLFRILACGMALCLLLAGCGKDAEETISTETLPPPDDMAFTDVNEVVTAKDETNLRNYPGQGEESTVLYTLKNGELATRIAISDSGWSILDYDGMVCYAVSSYLTTDLDYVPSQSSSESDDGIRTEFQESSGVVTAKDVVNLRRLPSTTDPDAAIIAELHNGDTAEILGVSSNGWTKLRYQEEICYAVSSYLTTNMNYTPPTTPSYADEDGIHTVFEDADGEVTAKDAVNLRTLPSITNPEATVITQLHKGEVAQRLGVSKTGWTKLSYDGKTCYAVTSYLTTDLDGGDDEDDDVIKTQFKDMDDQVTAKDEVNLRTMPSTTNTNAQVVKTLKHGEIVTRTGVNDDVGWSRVEYEGQTLYCVTRYLEKVMAVQP